MKTKTFSGALGVAALSIGLGACGDMSSSSTISASALPRSALVAKVNSICVTAQARARAVPVPSSFGDPAVAAPYFDKIAPITQTETHELQGLVPASDAQVDYRAFVSAQVQANDLLTRLKREADAKDPSGLEDLKKVQSTGRRVAVAAMKLGATTCAAG